MKTNRKSIHSHMQQKAGAAGHGSQTQPKSIHGHMTKAAGAAGHGTGGMMPPPNMQDEETGEMSMPLDGGSPYSTGMYE